VEGIARQHHHLDHPHNHVVEEDENRGTSIRDAGVKRERTLPSIIERCTD
jgi:hypothetical protein